MSKVKIKDKKQTKNQFVWGMNQEKIKKSIIQTEVKKMKKKKKEPK